MGLLSHTQPFFERCVNQSFWGGKKSRKTLPTFIYIYIYIRGMRMTKLVWREASKVCVWGVIENEDGGGGLCVCMCVCVIGNFLGNKQRRQKTLLFYICFLGCCCCCCKTNHTNNETVYLYIYIYIIYIFVVVCVCVFCIYIYVCFVWKHPTTIDPYYI